MIVRCPKCGKHYDDIPNWTICPHNPLDVAHDAPYCSRHDYFNCWICAKDPSPSASQEALDKETKQINEDRFTDGHDY